MGIVPALVVGSLYEFVLVSLWGATFGAMLFGLRVRSADGARAPWWRVLIRTGIRTGVGALPILFHRIAQAAGYEIWLQTHGTAFAMLSSMSTLGITAAMFLTARRENGYASLYDMISGTRVRVRPAERARHVGMATVPSPAETAEDPSGGHIGPFTVVAAVGNAGAGRLFAGYDAVLRRRVWIRTAPPGTPPIAPARRDISRVTRLHWLTGQRSATENWDAFEAPSGGPLLKRNEASLDWPAARVVLADLLHEFAAALKEGSLPPLGLDRLWMRADGRTVLLDFEAPGVMAAPSSAGATPMELLAAVTGRVTMPGAVSKDSSPRLPLSASVLLRRWSREAPRSLEEAQAQLREAAASRDRLSRWRRAVPIAMAAMPILLLGLFALVALPNADVLILTSEDLEVIGLLSVLRTDVPSDRAVQSPEYRSAIETYLAGQHGALLRNTRYWSSSMQGQDADQPELRRLASDIVARYPSVTAEELVRSRETIRSTLDSVRPSQGSGFARSPRATVLTLMTAIGSSLALFFSILSPIAIPGGVTTRMIGLAVVTRDGNEIGRWRSLARTLIAWAPILVWLVSVPAQITMGPGTGSVLAIGLVFGPMIAGVVWTIAAASRGLHDRIAGTWVVPR